MGHRASRCVCEHFLCSRRREVSACWSLSPTTLEDTAPELTLYTNGGFVDVYPGWLYEGANPYMVMIVFTCPPGRSLEDLGHSLQLEMAASSSIDAHFWSGSCDSTHACGFLVLSTGAPPSFSDVVSLLGRLPIDPVRTRLWRRPDIPFLYEVLPWLVYGGPSISPGPEAMDIDTPGAVYGGQGDDGAASISPDPADDEMPDAVYVGQKDDGHEDDDEVMTGM